MEIMEFLETNYVWVIVIGVVLLMTIIGYFADKSDKAKLKSSNKERKISNPEEKNIEESSAEVIEEEPIEASYNEKSELDDWNTLPSSSELEEDTVEKVDTLQEEKTEEPQSELDFTFDNDNNNNDYRKEVADEVYEEVELGNDELVSSPIEENEQEDIINNGITEIEEEKDNSEDLEITLPSIETLDNEIKDVVEEEDVWKF